MRSPMSSTRPMIWESSRGSRLAFDITTQQASGEYVYSVGWDKKPKAAGELKAAKVESTEKMRTPEKAAKMERAAKPSTVATRISALAPVGSNSLLVLERTSTDARLYLADLDGATNILGGRW